MERVVGTLSPEALRAAGPDKKLMVVLTRSKGNALQKGYPLRATACGCGPSCRLEDDHCVKCGRLSAEAIRKAWGGVPMPVRTKITPTPKSVVMHGWRDEPRTGPDSCEACEGWGCKTTTLKNESVMHRTCPGCKGRGWL